MSKNDVYRNNSPDDEYERYFKGNKRPKMPAHMKLNHSD